MLGLGVDLRDVVESTKITLQSLSNRTIAIDAYNALYQFLAIIRGEGGEHLVDRQGRVTSHISGLFYRNINLLELGIRPIYILDGQPPSLKAAEIQRRIQVRQEATARYRDAYAKREFAEAKRYAQATSMIENYMVEDTKKILGVMGIPWLEAPSEGEATAAHLTIQGVADAAVSQDYDSLLFGARMLVRNVTISGRRKLPGKPIYVEVPPEKIDLDSMLNQLKMTRKQLVDVGILVGTDFNPGGFKGIGPATAVKLIKRYGGLEKVPGITEALSKIDYQSIREIFLKPMVLEHPKVSWKRPTFQGLIDFLVTERDFSEDRVKKALQRLEEKEASREDSLERWF